VTITDTPADDSGNDDITIVTRGALTVAAGNPITNDDGGNITLAAEGTAVSDDVDINANVTTIGGNGNVSIYAGDSIDVESAVTISAAGSGAILLSASTDFNTGVPQNGYNGTAAEAGTAGRVVMQDGSVVQSRTSRSAATGISTTPVSRRSRPTAA